MSVEANDRDTERAGRERFSAEGMIQEEGGGEEGWRPLTHGLERNSGERSGQHCKA